MPPWGVGVEKVWAWWPAPRKWCEFKFCSTCTTRGLFLEFLLRLRARHKLNHHQCFGPGSIINPQLQFGYELWNNQSCWSSFEEGLTGWRWIGSRNWASKEIPHDAVIHMPTSSPLPVLVVEYRMAHWSVPLASPKQHLAFKMVTGNYQLHHCWKQCTLFCWVMAVTQMGSGYWKVA